MIDTKHRRLVEYGMQRRAEFFSRRQIAAEGFFEHHARTPRTARLTQPLYDSRELAGRHRQVVERVCRAAKLRADPGESLRIPIVAANIAQQAKQLREGVLLYGAIPADALAGSLLELLEGPIRSRHSDHRHVEPAAPRHRVECGENFLINQIAGGPEKDQGVGALRAHGSTFLIADGTNLTDDGPSLVDSSTTPLKWRLLISPTLSGVPLLRLTRSYSPAAD